MSKANAKPKSKRGAGEEKHPGSRNASSGMKQLMAQMMERCSCGPEMMAKMADRMGCGAPSKPAEPTEEA